jgi:Ion transport protein
MFSRVRAMGLRTDMHDRVRMDGATLASLELPTEITGGKEVDAKTRKDWEMQRKAKLAEVKAAKKKARRQRKRVAKKEKLANPKWGDNCYGNAQKKVYWAFENTDRPLGRILNGGVILLVIFSVISFLVETMPQFYEEDPGHNTFFWMETGVVAIFTVELGLRFWATPLKLKWEFCKNGMNIIDFLAIFPYYLELVVDTGVSGFQVIRIIRLARIMRLFKLPRFTVIVALLRRGIVRGKEGLYLMIFFLFMSLILFGSIMYYAEGADATWEEDVGDFGMWIYNAKRGGGESPFSSIPASLWWAVVTQTTGMFQRKTKRPID